MVRVVEESQTEYRYQGYLENNRDLARKVSELEQQLNLTTQEIYLLRSISHQKDVKILELENQVNELQQYKKKHDFIKNIILGDRLVESTPHSIIHQTTSIQAITDSEHAETSRRGNDSSQQEEYSEHPTTRDILRPIVESEEEEEEEQQSPNETDHEEADEEEDQEQEENEQDEVVEEEMGAFLEAIEEEDEEEEEEEEEEREQEENQPIQHNQQDTRPPTPTRIEDSLEPVNVTYVPPINQPERTCHTPSIWNCLDSVKSDESVKLTAHSPVRSGLKISQTMNSSSPIHPIINRSPLNEDVFHSTPVQPTRVAKPRAKRPSRRSENEAPCTRYNLRKRAKVAN